MEISKIPQTRTFTKKIFGGTLTISIEKHDVDFFTNTSKISSHTQSKPFFCLTTDKRNIQANSFLEFLQKILKSFFLQS